MLSGHQLEFKCTKCEEPVGFSVLDSREGPKCGGCQKEYAFDETLIDHLGKFEGLCRQLQKSEDILSSASVAVNVGPHHVEFPLRLLLTRLNSVIRLEMEGKETLIQFRVEPSKDLPEAKSA